MAHRFTIASIASNLDEFRKLPQNVQGRALLKALADRFPKTTFNRQNLLLEPYGTVDPDGFAIGFPESERHTAVKYLFGAPWRYLVNNGYIFDTGHDFHEITPEGWEDAAAEISAVPTDRTIIDALRFLHPDLRSYEHYFREQNFKEAVATAFIRVENRLNEIRDASANLDVKAMSGVSLPHKLFDTGNLKFPFPRLAAGNQKGREAYSQQLKNLLTSGVGWFRNSFAHEPHNLPDLDARDTLELLFIASYMPQVIDKSV
jgi:hypothetical protein